MFHKWGNVWFHSYCHSEHKHEWDVALQFFVYYIKGSLSEILWIVRVTSTEFFEFVYFSTVPGVRTSTWVLSMPVNNATVTSLFLSSTSFILYSLAVLQFTVYETPYFEPNISLVINLSSRIWKVGIFKILVPLYRQNLVSVLINISVGMHKISYTKAWNSCAKYLNKSIFYLTRNVLRLHYKDHPVNGVKKLMISKNKYTV